MLDENKVFKIDLGCSHEQLQEVHRHILEVIKDIKVIEIDQNEALQSSALLSLLKTIKQSEPDIEIPLLQSPNATLQGLGNFEIMHENKSNI